MEEITLSIKLKRYIKFKELKMAILGYMNFWKYVKISFKKNYNVNRPGKIFIPNLKKG